MQDTRTLVVYYSRGGNTRRVAHAIAAGLHADLEELADPMERQGTWGYWRCTLEALFARPVRLRALSRDPASYDLVIIGTPVWVGRPSSVVRAFLVQYHERLPRVAFFITHGGTARERVLALMASLAGRDPVAQMAVRERDLRGGDVDRLVGRFVVALQQTAPAHV